MSHPSHMRERRALLLLARSAAAVVLVLLAACGTPPIAATPTVIVEVIATPLPTDTLTPSPSPSPPAQVAPPTDTATLAPPTETPVPTATPGPVEYTIQEGDTLLFIIQQPPFNYRDPSVIREILRLNPLIPSADRLPPPGTVILIPLPTPTATPEVGALTATFQAGIPVVTLPVNTIITQHTIREGETILGVAEQFRTTLRILSDLNPEVGFFNCDFANPSGGPDCTVILNVGQTINVPAPTPTPTLSPTPSGSETPTPTPTFAPPMVAFPPRDAAINSSTPFTFQWVSAGVLGPQQAYLVQIENITTGAAYNDITRATSYRIPVALIPPAGEPHQFRWRVSVAQPNAEGLFVLAGAEGEWRGFSWRSG